VDQGGSYGIQQVPGPDTYPSARHVVYGVMDHQNNIVIYGGSLSLSDMYMFHTEIQLWSW
jgi:hypothetical protein